MQRIIQAAEVVKGLIYRELPMRLVLSLMFLWSATISVAQGSWYPFDLGTQDTLRAVTFKLGLGYAVGDVFGIATGDSSVILQTYDRGVTWVRKTFATSGRLNERRRLYSIHCITSGTCIASGGADATPPVVRAVIYRTTDAGTNWSYLTNGPSTWWSVHCTGNTCYGASDQNVYKSTDFALTWSGLINSGSGGRNAYAVYCMNVDTCTWGGSLGMIRKTVDGGTSWSTKSSGVTRSLRATYLSGGNVGWTVGDTGIILKTNDSGSTWSTQVSGTARNLRSIYFLNADTGWVVGDGGTILYTADGGVNWIPQLSGTTRNLYSVYFGSYPGIPVLGFIVGAGGTMLRYSPTVGITPGRQTKSKIHGKLNPKMEPAFDSRGKQVEVPCRSCLLDARKESRLIGE